MINVILCGACGRLGEAFQKVVNEEKDVKIVAGVDLICRDDFSSFPLYKSFDLINAKADVVVDFSTPSALEDILDFCLKNNTRLLIATTGHSEAQLQKIISASQKIAVFKSENLSVGMSVLTSLVRLASELLSDFDVVVTETHHKKKLDAPSGTAKMLSSVIESSSADGKNRNVPVNSVRAGTAVGKHEVAFFGNFETVTITHEAYCKDVYAVGALRALRFLQTKPAGLFSTSDL